MTLPEDKSFTGPGPQDDGAPAGKSGDTAEPVWTYRGYKLHAGEFNTAMVHLFRAEVQRANVWRQRLDTTTNWAVVTTGAVISFIFTQPTSHHIAILLNVIFVTIFLIIETRRYRYYELWSSRVRLMETDFFAAMLVPPFQPAPDWAEALAENLLHPQFPISIWEAAGRRLRRNYIWIYTLIVLGWVAKLLIIPTTVTSITEVIFRARVGLIPGELVVFLGLFMYLSMIAFSILTIGLQQASGEVLPRYGNLAEGLAQAGQEAGHPLDKMSAWFRPHRRRQQVLTLIITDRPNEVSARIIKEMSRGVTSLPGIGMYTGEAHTVLLVALTITEIPQLKTLMYEEDPKAFVVVSPAQEVFGKGFIPLEVSSQ